MAPARIRVSSTVATPRKNVDAEPARSDRRGDRRDPHTHHRGDAHAGEDDAGSERQLDEPQQLTVGSCPSPDPPRAPQGQRQQSPRRCCGRWEEGVDDERGGLRSTRRSRTPESGARRGRDWGWSGRRREAEHRPAPGRTAGHEDTERQSDQGGDSGGNRDEGDVLPQEQPHFACVTAVKTRTASRGLHELTDLGQRAGAKLVPRSEKRQPSGVEQPDARAEQQPPHARRA